MDDKQLIRIGLVGAGMMGSTHSKAYQQVEGARVVAICDNVQQRAATLADRLGAAVYSSVSEMLERIEIDAIDICIPTPQHREVVELAASKGKHILCEKPIASSIEDAEAMIDICERNRVTLMVGHVTRFFPDYQTARKQVKSGEIGSPAVVRLIRSGAFPERGWYSDYAQSGGPLLDLAIHDFDYLLWTIGSVKRVFSRQYTSHKQVHALTLLRLENGTMAHVETSWAYPKGSPFQVALEIAGTEGLLEFNRSDATNVIQYGTGQPQLALHALKRNAYVRELQHFIECIKTGQTPLTSGEQAKNALQVSLAALDSVQKGTPIQLEVRS